MIPTDLYLHAAVASAIRLRLGTAAPHVVVSVRDGIATLGGRVASCSDKFGVVEAVQRVPGVLAVVEGLEVCANPAAALTDESLARAAQEVLATEPYQIGRSVKIQLARGWLTLTGTVTSSLEYLAVERALARMQGLRGVTNQVRIEDYSATGGPAAA